MHINETVSEQLLHEKNAKLKKSTNRFLVTFLAIFFSAICFFLRQNYGFRVVITTSRYLQSAKRLRCRTEIFVLISGHMIRKVARWRLF